MSDIEDEMLEFYEDNEETMNSSLYGERESFGFDYEKQIFGDTNLKVGVVTKIYEIDDDKNVTKLVPEYDVLAFETDGEKVSGTKPYRHCVRMDSFGSMSSYLDVKLRANKDKLEDEKSKTLSARLKDKTGSIVLILCLDGNTNKGVIINSYPHPGRKSTLTSDNGEQHLEGEYNGLNWRINKNGELKITFKSKTNEKGEPQDTDAGGTSFEIDKTGQVDINTNLSGDEETYMRMDKANKDVGLKAGQHIGFTAKKNIGLRADGKIFGKAKGDIQWEAEGTAKFTAKSSLDIEGKSVVNIKGGNVIISGQNGVIIEGQQCMIDTQKVFVGQGGTGAVIATTKFVGTGNHGAPVTCSAVGPFSSSVFIAS
jgi:phage gp45-like